MDKHNHYSQQFATKPSDDLRAMVYDESIRTYVKLAALWELERREEATEEELNYLHDIEERMAAQKEKKENATRYSTFGPRFLAAIIDGLVLIPVGLLADYLLGLDAILFFIMGTAIHNFAPYLYAIFFHGQFGQTLGKMATGIKVVDVETEGKITWQHAFLRDSVPLALLLMLLGYTFFLADFSNLFTFQLSLKSAATFIPLLIIAFLSIIWTFMEFFSMLFDKKSRAVHDKIAGTVVVRTK